VVIENENKKARYVVSMSRDVAKQYPQLYPQIMNCSIY